jgi:hypothetical protein
MKEYVEVPDKLLKNTNEEKIPGNQLRICEDLETQNHEEEILRS